MTADRHRFLPTRLRDVWRVESDRYRDARGAFDETFHAAAFADHGLPARFAIANWSRSRRGVLRGLHWQGPPTPMGKLVRCTRGRLYDVLVDLRASSPTFGAWQAWELSDRRCVQLWVPPGFAHGIQAMSAVADIAYLCTAVHEPSAEGTLAWDDPDLGIPWPLPDPILSERDRKGLAWREYASRPVFT